MKANLTWSSVLSQSRPGGKGVEHLHCRRQRTPAAGQESREWLHCPTCWLRFQSREHLEVLRSDDRPRVVTGEIGAPVGAHDCGQRRIIEQAIECCTELSGILVIQSRIAAPALPDQHITVSVRQYRTAERPRFERHHRETLE